MGFDMYWVERALGAEYGVSADNRRDPSYFRLNIWGMGATCRLMLREGMATAEVWPKLVEPGDFGLAEFPERQFDKAGREIVFPAGSAEDRFWRTYVDAIQGDSGGPIPVYKLMSNEGWLVTPGEIQRSFVVYSETHPEAATTSEVRTVNVPWCDEPIEVTWWDQWLSWLRAAAEHGGFEVW